MKVFKAFTKIIYYLVIVLLIVFIALRIFIPRKMDNIVNYKFYTVLTNSMAGSNILFSMCKKL